MKREQTCCTARGMTIGTKTLAIKTEDGTVYSMRFVASTAVPVHVVEVTCEGFHS